MHTPSSSRRPAVLAALALAAALIPAGAAFSEAPPAAAAAPKPAPAGLPSDPAARVNALADAYVKAFFQHFPDQATVQGIAGADHTRLPDQSLAGLEAWRDEEDALADELETVDGKRLSGQARITWEFLKELLAASIGARVCETELWNVSPTWTGWQASMTFLASVQPVGTPEARQAALARFRAIPRFLEGETARLREGVRRGYTAPKGNVRRVIEQMDSLLAGPVTGSPLYEPAQRDGDELFQAAFAEVIDEEVRPAIKTYRNYLESQYLPAAREAIAVAANPQGQACYRAAVRFHTSLDISAEEIHRRGVEQMERTTAAMSEIGGKSFGVTDAPALLAKVRQPPYTFKSRQEIVDVARAAVGRAEAQVPKWFGQVPTSKVEVVPYPEFRERSAPGGEYQAGSDDGTRPGTYYLNTYEAEKQSRAGIEATAFHETYPGHHLQGAIAKQVKGTHPIQRYFGSSGFSEGWALYSERLADEMGIYATDVDRLGLLSNEALRAGRLVVDSGMHALGWSRQQAIDYLLARTAETPERIAAEIDRYIAVPGQATAYMLGNLEIRRLREEARQRLGEGFSIREFHDQVLGDGAVTLAMLRGKVEGWLERKAPKPPAGAAPGR